MDQPLPDALRAFTDPTLLWAALRSLPLRVSIIRADADGGMRLLATDVTGSGTPAAPDLGEGGLDLRRAFDAHQVALLDEAHRTGRPVRFATPVELPDGTHRVVEGANVPLPDGHIITFTYNVTDHVAEVERAQEYASAILRVSRDRFWVTGRDLVIRHYEGPADWRTPSGSVGRHMREVYPQELVERFASHIEQTLATGEMQTVVADAVLEPGRVYETRIVPFGRDDVLLAARDVTEYHRNQTVAELRGALDDVSARALGEMFDLVGPALAEAGEAMLGAVGAILGADVVSLGRRVDDRAFERLFVWSRPDHRRLLSAIPRVVDASMLPEWFALVAEGDAIIVESVDTETMGPMAHDLLDSIQAQSLAIVPFQSADHLTAYLSLYWFADAMPDVKSVLGSIRSVGVNLLASARRSEAETARLEATEQLEQVLAALRVNEERFRLVSRATNDVLWDWNLVTDELWWGDGITSVLGYSRAELGPTITSWEQLIHAEDVDRVLGSIRAAINSGARSWRGEYRVVHRRGGYLWMVDRGEIVHDRDGRPIRMVGGMRDISERRRTESLLRSQARLLDAASDVIYERDLDGRVVYWNRAAERIYGWSSAAAIGRKVTELFHTDVDRYEAAMVVLLRDGEWSGEFVNRRSDGRELVIEARWALVRDDDGAPVSVLAINSDVTERRRLEQQLLRAQRMESIGTLAGGMAHDLNNVLTPILMTTELLRAGESDPDRQSSLAAIEMAAQRGADLVRLVLSFARGVEGRDDDVDVESLLRELEQLLTETLPRTIALRVAETTEPLHVAGDRTQLAQVLLNLCVNARDAMPDGGTLTIDARRGPSDDRVLITVSDTGTGIDASIADRVFDPFFTTKEPGAGTGLGLATAAAIVRGHHGTLEFHSDRDGTTFSMVLPLTGTPDAVTVEPEAPAVAAGGGEVVLVVDDEAVVLATIEQVLRTHGYRVVTVASGVEAVDVVRTADPPVDLVVTDLMMPGVDGIDMVRAMRDVRPGLPVVLTSGVKTDDAVARATDAGIAHFLAKPYSIAALLDAVEGALDRTEQRG